AFFFDLSGVALMACRSRGVQITRTIEIESTIPHDANSAASACPSMDDTVDGRRSCSWTRSLLRTELGSRGYTVHRTGRRVSGFVCGHPHSLLTLTAHSYLLCVL